MISLFKLIFLCDISDSGQKAQVKQNAREHIVSSCLNVQKIIDNLMSCFSPIWQFNTATHLLQPSRMGKRTARVKEIKLMG